MSQHSALDTSDLHKPGYVQASDPGSVGAGKLWVDTTVSTSPVLKIRNATNTGWDTAGGMGEGSFVPPSGSGFIHVTGGAMDGAACPVDLSGAHATGVLAAARHPALTGDVTTPSGSVATTIGSHAVSNSKLAQMPTLTLKGNNTGGTADADDLTVAEVAAMGLGGYSPPTGTGFPHITGGTQDGAARAVDLNSADATGFLAAGRFPALTGDVTTTAGNLGTTIASHAVTNAKQAQMPTMTIKGNNTGVTADVIDLTVAEVIAMGIGGGGAHTTTKGDIEVYGTAQTRLPVGPDFSHLVPDAATTIGLAWVGPWIILATSPKYGIVTGSVSTGQRATNRTGLNQAHADAQTMGCKLRLPPAKIECDFTAGGFTITSSIEIEGAGHALSSIDCYPVTTPSWEANVFDIQHTAGTGVPHVKIKGLTLNGPTTASSEATRGICRTSGSTTYTLIEVEDVWVTGEFTIGMLFDNAANGTVLIRNSNVTASEQGISYNADDGVTSGHRGYTGNHFHATDLDVHDCGSTSLMHDMYVHPNVSVDFDRCRFGSSSGYGIQMNGSPTRIPEYQRFRNCVWYGTNSGAVVGTNGALAYFESCTFQNGAAYTGVKIQGPTYMVKCNFLGPQMFTYGGDAVGQYGAQASKPQNHVFEECYFDSGYEGATGNIGCGGVAGSKHVWTFSKCYFACNNASTELLNNNPTEADTYLQLDRCTFNPANCSYGVRTQKGYTKVVECTFIGTYANYCLYPNGQQATYGFEFYRNIFRTTSGEPLRSNCVSGAYGTVRGKDNESATTQTAYSSGNTGEYQLIEPKSGLCPTNVSTAATLELDVNYDTFYLTGTTGVTRLRFGWSGDDSRTRVMCGRVTLICESAVTFTQGTPLNSDVAVIISPTISAAAGTKVEAYYDPKKFGWYLSKTA